MADQPTTPRLLYRGPTTDSAETTTAIDADDLAAKLKDGWRLVRVPAAAKADDAKPKAAK